MRGFLPLPNLLSHALVAFTIEFDNEFERQIPHRTTSHGSTPGSPHAPWLVSRVMWSNFMRFVADDGITVGDLQRLLHVTDKKMHAWLTRMGKWWGYVSVEPDIPKSQSKRIDPGTIVYPTRAGRMAQTVWRSLDATIEKRWQERFGADEIDHLRESLWAVASELDVDLPHSLPILGYGLFSRGPENDQWAPAGSRNDMASSFPLAALLSKVLLAFAIEFERDSAVSLAIGANVLRLVSEEGVRVRDLPLLAGVSKEAIAMSLGFLEKRGCAVVEPESPGSRVRVLVLTAKGRRARDAYLQRVRSIEERWQTRFGKDAIGGLRESLEQLAGEPTAQLSPLFRGSEPYPSGWRASAPRPEALPHYPMILHRGGYPDGS